MCAETVPLIGPAADGLLADGGPVARRTNQPVLTALSAACEN